MRLRVLRAAASLADFAAGSPPEQCHELNLGKRKGLYHISMDLDHPYRLILTPAHDPVPLRESGGLDWSRVTAVTILGIEDTHD